MNEEDVIIGTNTGKPLWLMALDRAERTVIQWDYDKPYMTDEDASSYKFYFGKSEPPEVTTARVLIDAIKAAGKTIDENKHLADGDDFTLVHLVKFFQK